jgi:hypothetical protein
VDNTTLAGATVQITGNYQNGQDVLSFANTANITGSFDAASGKMTLTGTDTLANYQAALRAIKYQNTSQNPNTSARTLTFQVNDGAAANNLSNAPTRGITVVSVNDAPTLTGLEGTALAYNQNTGPAAVTSAIVVSDVDSANLTGATVSVSAGYVNGQDTLSFTNQLGITGSFNATTGVLTLTGTTTLANYQTALRAVQFTNTTGSTTSKTISFQVNDGAGVNNLSATVSRNITINRAPTVTGESYSAVGNTPLLVGIAQGSTAAVVVSGSVLSNDSDPEGNTPISINGSTAASSGTVTLNNDGTFTYSPAAGFSGTATFTYTVKDVLGAISQPATVSIAVGTKVWYVDNSGANGDGRAATPFNTLANASTASGTGDIIFVNTGSGSYTAGVTLKQNQSLIGRGVALQVDPDGGGSAPTFTLLAAGTAPILTTTAAGTAGVTLNNTAGNVNTIRGLTIGSTTGAGIFGSNFGTLNADTVAINLVTTGRTGQILDLTTGAVSATFTNLTTTSAATGVNLVGLTGTLTASAGAISGVSGTDFNVGSGTASITFGGTITNTAGNSVVVSGHTGGTVTFSGAISDTGSGISLTNNTGATVAFSGGLSLNTGANAAFTATGGGTVNVTGTNNAGNTTPLTTTVINIANTTIGSSGVTFVKVSTTGAASGIILNTTGSGPFTITGDGGAANNGSGGVIQGSSGPGINLTSTGPVSLGYMNVQNGGDDGIRGSGVAGFTLNRSNVTLNGNAVGERGIEMTQLSGSGGITNSTVSGSAEHNVIITNDTANLTSFNVTGSTFSTTNFTTGDDGFQVLDTGSASMTVSVTGCTFTDNKGDHFQAATDADATGPMNITFNNNTLTTTTANDPLVIGGGITINTSGSTDITFQVNNNNIQQAFDDAININLDPGSLAGASMNGTISGNTIGTAGVVDSGSESSNDITVASKGRGTTTISVTNNTIREWGNGFGVFVGTTEGSSNVTATVTGNSVKNGGTFALNGIQISAGATAGPPADNGLLQVTLTGNDVTGSMPGVVGAGEDIRLRQRFSTTIKLPGYTGGNTDTAAVNAFVAANNDPVGATPAPTVSSAVNSPPGGGFIGGPPLLAAPGGIQSADPLPPPPPALTQADLAPILAEAIRRWELFGVTPAEDAALRAVTVQITDIGGGYLGQAKLFGATITLDDDAAGFGWFVDPTPRDDAEFPDAASATRLYARPDLAPAGRMDLLTTVMHELGHVLGKDSDFDPLHRDDLMYAYLTTGERRLLAVKAGGSDAVDWLSAVAALADTADPVAVA